MFVSSMNCIMVHMSFQTRMLLRQKHGKNQIFKKNISMPKKCIYLF